MLKRVLMVSGLASLLCSCSYNNVESVKSQSPIFTLLSNASVGKGKVNWLLIHNLEGNILFSKEFTPGDVVVATSDAVKEGDFMTVTFMQYDVLFGTQVKYDLHSYLNIRVNDTWVIQNDSTLPKDEIYLGDFQVTVSGFQQNSKLNISDRYGRNSNITYDGTANTFENALYSDAKKYLFTCRDPQGNLWYKFLQDPLINTNYTFQPIDLQSADYSVKVPLDKINNYSLTVVGGQNSDSLNSNGYIVHYEADQSPLPANLSISYPSIFTAFKTTLSLSNENGTYVYSSLGSKADNITLPTSQVFKVYNKTIQNFQLINTGDFQKRASLWEFNNYFGGSPQVYTNVSWTVNAPANAVQKFLQLPAGFNRLSRIET
jgi:hypothetical protein